MVSQNGVVFEINTVLILGLVHGIVGNGLPPQSDKISVMRLIQKLLKISKLAKLLHGVNAGAGQQSISRPIREALAAILDLDGAHHTAGPVLGSPLLSTARELESPQTPVVVFVLDAVLGG